ncbi:hypothetical protein F4859DRAFT_515092 [Xylaria cf. heliscus]|nr:hypothetical protein F4859DRAFT_515092 [Xylaria cf. heliscus]
MASSRQTMKWGPQVHEDILVAINDVVKLGREDWEYIIQALHGMGYSFTESALKTRSDLLQAIFDAAPPNAQQWKAISAKLSDKGYNYTLSAAQQHLQKLKKKEVEKKDGDAPGTPKKAPTPRAKNPGTPRVPRTPRTPRTTGTPSQKKRTLMNTDEDEDEDKADIKKLKIEIQAPNLGQYREVEPSPPSEGEI